MDDFIDMNTKEIKDFYDKIEKVSDKYNLTLDVIVARFHQLKGGYTMCKEDHVNER
jgi:hypothetical protein